MGIIDQPVLKERWVGAEGHPTTLNGMPNSDGMDSVAVPPCQPLSGRAALMARDNTAGNPVETRKCADLSSAYMYCTTPHMFSGATEAAFNRVRDSVREALSQCSVGFLFPVMNCQDVLDR